MTASVIVASRALRHGAVTSALVLAVCAALALVAGATLAATAPQLRAATERTVGTVTAVTGDTITLRWAPTGTAERLDEVALASPPPVGTRTEIAYDPAAPQRPLVPGSAVLADVDRALTTLVLAGTVAALVLVAGLWQVLSRGRLRGRPGRPVPVRRVRVAAGMTSRSWLETETQPRRWIPVHFDATLVGLPSPTTVRLLGDPGRDRLVAAEVDGRVLYPSGPVRSTEPRGRRTDNPSRPDASVAERAAALAPLRRQLRADLPLVIPAPLVALLWISVGGGGGATWAAATLLLAAFALWIAAIRGSDPC